MIGRLIALAKLPPQFWQMVISQLPGPAGFALRYRFWRKRLRYLGEGVLIGTGVYFQNPRFISIDDNCWIDNNVIILAGLDDKEREKAVLTNGCFGGEPGVVQIGKNVHIGPGTIISGISAGVHISDDCCLSTGCRVYAFTHHYRSWRNPSDATVHFGSMAALERQCILEGPVFIGANTGVALGGTILPGVAIPENCFVAINSVVVRGEYKKNSIIKGDPAKYVGPRFDVYE